MSHGIQKPIDRIYSTVGTEWHKLADKEDTITLERAREFFFPIVTATPQINIGDQVVMMPDHKALVADYSGCRPDLLAAGKALVPLHIPKKGYEVITNEEVFNFMEKAVKEIDGEITVIGSINAGKKFWLSVRPKGEKEIKINNEKILANIIALTSHDGTYGFKFYDSMTRPVCQNTITSSLCSKGAINESIFHTKNAGQSVEKLANAMRGILAGRGEFVALMEKLAQESVSKAIARNLYAGYFATTQGEKDDGFSTRTENAIDELENLFQNGLGNDGRTMYDVLNGATQYWTSGGGTGQKSSPMERAYKANFGLAATHKARFLDMIANPEKRGEMIEAGKKALANS